VSLRCTRPVFASIVPPVLSHATGGTLAAKAEGEKRVSILSPARLATVAFGPKEPPGTYQYLFRLVGMASKVRSSTTQAGPKLRLAGQFLAGYPGRRPYYFAAFMIVPEAIAEAVRRQFEKHDMFERRSLRVLIAYDVWAVRRDTVLGYEYHCDGEAWVPIPMMELAERFETNPVPKRPVNHA
jgi:hypothetical protein